MGRQIIAKHQQEDEQFFNEQEQMEVSHHIQNSQPVVKDNVFMAGQSSVQNQKNRSGNKRKSPKSPAKLNTMTRRQAKSFIEHM